MLWNFWYPMKRSSLPSWECGLKCLSKNIKQETLLVAPFVGVWIEIWRRLWRRIEVWIAPFVGVWIEIPLKIDTFLTHVLSLPSWECGLKFLYFIMLLYGSKSLPSWECGLKLVEGYHGEIMNKSLPSWECGLKYFVVVAWHIFEDVAPFVGVWIEIAME